MKIKAHSVSRVKLSQSRLPYILGWNCTNKARGGTVLQTAIRHSLVWMPVQTSLSSKHLTIFCCHDNKPSHSIRIAQIIHGGREILVPNHFHFKMRDSRKHMEVNSKYSVTTSSKLQRAPHSSLLTPHSPLHLLHCCQQSCS